jgi:uncharacterized NAD(P)/FAD-binding protein YdhS
LTRCIAIVGAGFSGSVLAAQLLRLSAGQACGRWLRIVLIDRGPALARGLAYGTDDAAHLLNVPAGNMSALADDPHHFLRHAQALDPGVQPQSFLPRAAYGAYLQALLDSSELAAAAAPRLERWVGEVTHILPAPTPGSAPLQLRLADGRELGADHVVLALGHHAPADPKAAAVALRASPRYIREPWAPGALSALRALAPGPVLLLGSGLTALDLALTLTRGPTPRPVLCLSRRGRVPAAHRVLRDDADPARTAAHVVTLRAALGQGVRSDLRALRRAVRAHAAQGGDWRDLIAALRAHTPPWWQATALAERRRFLRHLQAWWDSLRHRCAPQALASFQAARDAGLVQVMAGRLAAVQPLQAGLRVHWTRRGHTATEVLDVAALVNCTGADTRLQQLDSALVRQLLAQGLLVPDALGLGALVDEEGACIDREGRPGHPLHCLGPWLRARDWEATAVPELRAHALRLARRLLDSLDSLPARLAD